MAAKEVKRGDIIQTKDKNGLDVYSLVLAGPFKNGILQVARLSPWSDFEDCRELEIKNPMTNRIEHVNVFSMLTTTWPERITRIVGVADETTMRRIAGAMFKVVAGMYEYSPEKGYHLKDFSISIPASMLFKFGLPGELPEVELSKYAKGMPTFSGDFHLNPHNTDLPDEDTEYQACPFTVGRREDKPTTDDPIVPVRTDVQGPDGKTQIVIGTGPRSGGFDKSGAASTKAIQTTKTKKPRNLSKKQIEAHNNALLAAKKSEEKINDFKEKISKLANEDERINLIFDVFGDPMFPKGYIAIRAAAMSITDNAQYPPIKLQGSTILLDRVEFLRLLNKDPNICIASAGYEFLHADGSRSTVSVGGTSMMSRYAKTVYNGHKDTSIRMLPARPADSNRPRNVYDVGERIDKIFSTGIRGERTVKYLDELKKFIIENKEFIPIFAKGIDTDKWINPTDLQMMSISLSYPSMRYVMLASTLYDTIYKMPNSNIPAFIMMSECITAQGSIRTVQYCVEVIKYIACFVKWASLYTWKQIDNATDADKLIDSYDGMFGIKEIGYNIGIRGTKIMAGCVGISDKAISDIMLRINAERNGKKSHVGYANMLSSNTDKLLIQIEEKTKISLDPSSPSVQSKKRKFSTTIKKGSVE